jgi:hypothetical protein
LKACVLLLSMCVATILPGCTAAEKNNSAREWQRAECNRIIDKEDRDRCLKRIE